MRLDHIAYRVLDRHKTAEFFCTCMDYEIIDEFEPTFSDGTTQGVKCLVLRRNLIDAGIDTIKSDQHEIFISDGPKDSIVGRWIEENGSGIHHLAYDVYDVESTMREWQTKGYAEFSSEVIRCEGLEQVFTKPSQLTGVVIELIKRDKQGFCKDSVAKLMESTDELERERIRKA